MMLGGPLATYGRHLLQLGESLEPLILNNLPSFTNSIHFTCLTHGKGASVEDYVVTIQDLRFICHL
jgi:hypothetical protein